MKAVFITGSHGFLGTALREHLKLEQHKVRTKITEGDRLGNFPSRQDIIYDFASYGNLYDQQDVNQIYQTNVIRLLNLLQNSNKYKYKAFVIIGSSSEYGKRKIFMEENLLPLPETFYASSKVAATMLGQAWYRQYDKPIVIVRPFTVIGPGEPSVHLIPRLIESCITGKEMDFDPKPVHDFIDSRDFCDGLFRVVKNIKRVAGEIINIGTGIQTSNEEIRLMVEKITNRKANVKIVSKSRIHDSPVWAADNFRLKNLGWKQNYTIEQTIREMVRKT